MLPRSVEPAFVKRTLAKNSRLPEGRSRKAPRDTRGSHSVTRRRGGERCNAKCRNRDADLSNARVCAMCSLGSIPMFRKLAGWLRVNAAAISSPGGVERSHTQKPWRPGTPSPGDHSTSQTRQCRSASKNLRSEARSHLSDAFGGCASWPQYRRGWRHIEELIDRGMWLVAEDLPQGAKASLCIPPKRTSTGCRYRW